jgi:hypothetical protein
MIGWLNPKMAKFHDAEKDGVPYFIQDIQAELLAIAIFDQYMRMDGNELATWIEAKADTREFYRQIARGTEPLVQM